MTPNSSRIVIQNEHDWQVKKSLISQYIVPEIIRRERIPDEDYIISGQGTNLVCFFCNCVLKIFAPSVGHYEPKEDCLREVYLLEKLKQTSITCPQLRSFGVLEKGHTFYYILLSRIHMQPIGAQIRTFSASEVSYVGALLQDAIKELQNIDIEDVRLGKQKINSNYYMCSCLVHGDLSGENVLYDSSRMALIDFEDWMYVPYTAEYPAIVCDLLNGDRRLIEAFFAASLKECIYDVVADGLIWHYRKEQFIESIRDNPNLSKLIWGKTI